MLETLFLEYFSEILSFSSQNSRLYSFVAFEFFQNLNLVENSLIYLLKSFNFFPNFSFHSHIFALHFE
jgi:hypothetical protein